MTARTESFRSLYFSSTVSALLFHLIACVFSLYFIYKPYGLDGVMNWFSRTQCGLSQWLSTISSGHCGQN